MWPVFPMLLEQSRLALTWSTVFPGIPNDVDLFQRTVAGPNGLMVDVERCPLSPSVAKRNAHMNWDQIAGKWTQVKGLAKERWGQLTDDDIEASQDGAASHQSRTKARLKQ